MPNLADAGWNNTNAMELLSNTLGVGAAFLDATGEPTFVNSQGHELLGYADAATLRSAWPQVRAQLGFLPQTAGCSQITSNRVEYGEVNASKSLRLELYPLGEAGADGCFMLLHDRLGLQVLEHELLLASQMHVQNTLYGALLHDLRSPLNAMQITVELLDESVSGNEIASQHQLQPARYIGVMREELSRLNRLLNSALEGGAPLSQERRDFDVSALLRDIESLLAPQLKRQRVTLSLGLPSKLATVRGRRDVIKQALLNLLIIALAQTPTGGAIKLDVELSETGVAIGLQAGGSGLSEALLSKIYQIYFTTEKSADSVGLYVARLVIEAHGGEFNVANVPGQGVCFDLSLPLANTALREGALG